MLPSGCRARSDSSHVARELAHNERQSGELKYTCGMDMIAGVTLVP
jgi:hypothetical protein